MKKFYAFLSALLIANIGIAQITLTEPDHTPQVGESFDFVQEMNPTGIDVHGTGANQTWDLTTVSSTPGPFNYVSPSNASKPSTFPSANIVEISTNGAENYMEKNSAGCSFWGHYLPNQAEVIYTDKREWLFFPMTYNDNASETFAGTVENLQAGQTFDRSGNIEIKASGYGKLYLPYDTINDVLKVSEVVNYADKDQSTGTTYYTYVDTIYRWYHAPTNNYIASWSINYTNGTPYNPNAAYMDQSSIASALGGSYQQEEVRVDVYPNPSTSVVNIESSVEVRAYTVMDMTGKVVIRSSRLEKGVNEVDVSGLEEGVYFIQFEGKDKSFYTEKLVVN